MKLILCATIEGMGNTYYACKQIPDYQRRCFAPLKTCDEGIVAYATGDQLAGSWAVREVITTREDTAEEIAKELAAMIVACMKDKDTYNGYLKED